MRPVAGAGRQRRRREPHLRAEPAGQLRGRTAGGVAPRRGPARRSVPTTLGRRGGGGRTERGRAAGPRHPSPALGWTVAAKRGGCRRSPHFQRVGRVGRLSGSGREREVTKIQRQDRFQLEQEHRQQGSAAGHFHERHCRGVVRVGRRASSGHCWLFDWLRMRQLRVWEVQTFAARPRQWTDGLILLPVAVFAVAIANPGRKRPNVPLVIRHEKACFPWNRAVERFLGVHSVLVRRRMLAILMFAH